MTRGLFLADPRVEPADLACVFLLFCFPSRIPIVPLGHGDAFIGYCRSTFVFSQNQFLA